MYTSIWVLRPPGDEPTLTLLESAGVVGFENPIDGKPCGVGDLGPNAAPNGGTIPVEPDIHPGFVPLGDFVGISASGVLRCLLPFLRCLAKDSMKSLAGTSLTVTPWCELIIAS